MIAFDSIVGFDQDEGNARRNEKHGVTQAEAEEVFLHRPLVLAPDVAHSSAVEPRFHALGVTRAGRRLHLTVTIRGSGSLIRVISARDMHRKERAIYDKADQTPAEVRQRGCGTPLLGDSRLDPLCRLVEG